MTLRAHRRIAGLVTAVGALCLSGNALAVPARITTVSQAALSNPSDDCGAPSATPVVDGQPIVVTLAPVTFTVGTINPYVWRHPLRTDPAWRLWFEGFMYLPPLALRAYLDGAVESLRTMVSQVVASHAQNPDPKVNNYGWDEGTAQRRLQTENCLFRLTSDSRLRLGMAADASVQLGPRYYGPPYAHVHNHGTMANLRLVRAGELLGVTSWRTTAIRRFQTEAPLAFSRLGTAWEQASAYHLLSLQLWQQAADLLARYEPTSSAIAIVRAAVARATVALAWMTSPGGKIVPIGDSSPSTGLARVATDRVFRDDATGWLIGRWSWTDPSTSYYLLRYGPPRWAHGHDDRDSIVWTTFGEEVLVDPGYFTGDPASNWWAWQWSAAAHNVAVLAGTRRSSAPVSITGATVQAAAHAWRVEDDVYALHHVRTLNINRTTRTLRVGDSFAGPGIFDQYWHLGPRWQLLRIASDRHSAVFVLSTGRRLTVTSTGVIAAVIRGATRPVAGWVFPRSGQRVAAWQLRIRAITRTISTAFVVT